MRTATETTWTKKLKTTAVVASGAVDWKKKKVPPNLVRSSKDSHQPLFVILCMSILGLDRVSSA